MHRNKIICTSKPKESNTNIVSTPSKKCNLKSLMSVIHIVAQFIKYPYNNTETHQLNKSDGGSKRF